MFQTLFNIIKSNYSISFDAKKIMELFEQCKDEYYVKKAMEYIVSDEGIKKQRENNKYPIIKGGTADSITPAMVGAGGGAHAQNAPYV